MLKGNRMRQIAFTSALTIALFSTAVHAGEIAQPIAAFEGMTKAKLTVTIGGPLDVDGGPALRLFGGSRERAARFRSALLQSVRSELEACHLAVDESTEDEVAIRVFGRPAPDVGCGAQYVFLVEVLVFNARHAKQTSSDNFVSLRPVIGVVNDGAIEEELINTTLAMISDELENCPAA